MSTQEQMGRKIRALREEMNLSQSALAEKVGYKDKTSIAKIEAGKVDLPQSKVSAFANSLGTTISYLFENEEDAQPTTMVAHFDGTEFSEEQLSRIKAFAAFIKSEEK